MSFEKTIRLLGRSKAKFQQEFVGNYPAGARWINFSDVIDFIHRRVIHIIFYVESVSIRRS